MENSTYRIPLSLSNPRHEMRPVGTFHWTPDAANTLWFIGWIPGTEGEYLSTCLGLFIMAVMMRGLGAIEIFITARLRTQSYYQLPSVVLLKRKKNGSLRRNLTIQSRGGASSSKTIATDDFISIQISDDDDGQTTYMSATSRPHSVQSRKKGKSRNRISTMSRQKVAVEPRMPWVPPFCWKTETVRSALKTLEYFLFVLLMMVILTGNVAYFASILGGVASGEVICGRLRGSIHRYL